MTSSKMHPPTVVAATFYGDSWNRINPSSQTSIVSFGIGPDPLVKLRSDFAGERGPLARTAGFTEVSADDHLQVLFFLVTFPLFFGGPIRSAAAFFVGVIPFAPTLIIAISVRSPPVTVAAMAMPSGDLPFGVVILSVSVLLLVATAAGAAVALPLAGGAAGHSGRGAVAVLRDPAGRRSFRPSPVILFVPLPLFVASFATGFCKFSEALGQLLVFHGHPDA
mmetsp:Transcript_94003/g.196123  ORF Transcript_94003/g.196123 Transcript_94003/m.196123 type:complete len:222 (-) Transcript_94003:566-1231(-)